MSWRTLIITIPSKINVEMEQLVVTNENRTRVYLNELDTVIIEHPSSIITAHAMNELVDYKVNVIICNSKHNPHASVSSLYGHHHQNKRINEQISWDDVEKNHLWDYIVKAKIRNQALVLKALSFDTESIDMLLDYANEVKGKDSLNREGTAAKMYFNRMFGSSFIRSDDNAINHGLNYGYAIIASMINRSLINKGCFLGIGIFHCNEFNHFNLSYDFIEPFRPIIDYFIYNNVLHTFDVNEKRQLLDYLQRKISYAGKLMSLTNAIDNYCSNLLLFLSTGDHDYLIFPVIESFINEG